MADGFTIELVMGLLLPLIAVAGMMHSRAGAKVVLRKYR